MPHIIVEHSLEIAKPQLNNLLLALNKNIARSEGNFAISECKARAILCSNFVVADADNVDFIHITIRIMAGRSLEIRKKLAENLLKMVGDFIRKNNLVKNKIKLSLDVAEMEKEVYQKTIIDQTT